MSIGDATSGNGAGGGSGKKPGFSRRVFRFASLLVTILFVLALTVFYQGVDLFGISEATSTHSAKIAARIAAPMYGYVDGTPSNPDYDFAPNVAASTQNITVVLIDSASLKQLNAPWPPDYADQSRILRRILRYKPRALFVNLTYSYDRGGLTPYLERLARDGGRLTTAGQLGVSQTGVLLPVIGETIAWSDEEVVDELLSDESPFEKGVVGLRDASGYYPYDATLTLPNGETKVTRSAAFRLFELTCAVDAAPDAPRRIGFPGCADLDALKARENGELWVEWGAAHPEVWQFLGDHVGASPEALAAATAQSKTCRYFGADWWSRFVEMGSQVLNVFFGEREESVDRQCPYHVTLTAFDVFANNDRMPEYLRWAIEDKIVLVGSKIPGASPRVEIIDTQGPAVYLHAMALDNLLNHGAGHLSRSRPLSDAFASNTALGGFLAQTGLSGWRLSMLPEILTVLMIVVAHLQLRRPLARLTPSLGSNPLIEFMLPFASWMLITWIIAGLSAFITLSYFALSPHDWVGTFLVGGASSKLLDAVHPIGSG